MKKITFSTVLLLGNLFVASLFAQPASFVPVSPEASALAKIVNHPVNLNTGVPGISIPIFNVESGTLQLPISLTYHSTGFSINEHSPRTGLGWSLTTDIQITRSINGLDDFYLGIGYVSNPQMKAHYLDYSQGYYTQYPLYYNDWINAYRIAQNELDAAPDKFSYKLLNKQGSFYFRKNDAGNGYDIVPVPFDNLKITYSNNVFTIIDTDGTVYKFGREGSSNQNISDYIEYSNNQATTYKCDYIVNPNQPDTISFEYVNKNTEIFVLRSESTELFTRDQQPDCWNYPYYTPDVISTQNPWIQNYEQLTGAYDFYSLSYPRYIQHFGGKPSVLHLPHAVNQNGTTTVVDYAYPSMASGNILNTVMGRALSKIKFRDGTVEFTGADQLTSLVIKDFNNNIVKRANFYISNIYAPYSSTPPTRYLDSLHVLGNGSEIADRYEFLYKSKHYFGDELIGKDAWGHPNNNTSFIVQHSGTPTNITKKNLVSRFYTDCYSYFDNVPLSFGNALNAESVDKEGAQKGVLRRIIYPTGGYVNFDFESNMYKETTGSGILPVQMGGGLRIRAITYYDGVNLTPVSQKYYKYGEHEDGVGIAVAQPGRTYNQGSYRYDGFSYQQQIAYVTALGSPSVPCSTKSCVEIIAKEVKTTFMPAGSQRYDLISGSPIYYTRVTEYNMDHGRNTGKIVHDYFTPNEFTILYPQKIPGTNIDFLRTDGLTGMEKKISKYKWASGKYKIEQEKEFEYVKYAQEKMIKVVYAFNGAEVRLVGGSFYGVQSDLYNSQQQFHNWGSVNGFTAGQYGIEVAKLLLSKETEKLYEGDGQITNITQYGYTGGYNFPTSIETTGSNGKIRKKFLYYSFNSSPSVLNQEMLSRNMLSQVLEDREFEYDYPGATGKELVSKKTVYLTFSNNRVLPKFFDVSHGDGYQTEYTIDLYSDRGNIRQITTKDGIVSSYIWGYGHRYLLGEVKGASIASLGAYIDEQQLQSISDPSALRTVFSNLRTSVPTAMVLSFTHKPLVGITSTTSPSGDVRHFEFDHAGRLVDKKDRNNMLVSKNAYSILNSSSALAQTTHTSITPSFQSYNRLNSANQRIIYNYIWKGGTHTFWGSTVPYPYIIGSDHEALSFNPGPDDTQALANVLFELYLWVDPGIDMPDGIHIDFIQNGHVVFTKEFEYFTDHRPVQLYIPEGEYQINVRVDANFSGGILSNHFYQLETSSSNFYYTMFNAPLSINFTPDKLYSVTIMNY